MVCLGYYRSKKLTSGNAGPQSADRALLSMLIARVYVLFPRLSFCNS